MISKKLSAALAFVLLVILSACTNAQTHLPLEAKDSDSDTISDVLINAVESEELLIPGITLCNSPYINGRMMIYSQDNDEKRWGYLDASGNVAIATVCLVPDVFSDGYLRTRVDEDRYVYLDVSGNVVLDQVADTDIIRCDTFRDGYTVVELKGHNGSYVVDTAGRIVFAPEEYEYYYRNLGSGLFARTTTEGLNAVIVSADKDTSCYNGICDLQYSADPVGYYSSDDELYGLWNFKTNEKITEAKYVYISEFSDEIAIVSLQNGSYYVIDDKGTVISNLSQLYPNKTIDSVVPFGNGRASISLSDSKGMYLIDAIGDIIQHTSYDKISCFYDGIAVCMKDGLYGYCNASGEEIVTPQYQYASNFENGVAFATDGNAIYRITK